MASVQNASQYGHPKPSHERLPSIQNILSSRREPSDRARDAAAATAAAATVPPPPPYARDPFCRSTRMAHADYVPRTLHHPQSHHSQQHMPLPLSMAALAEPSPSTAARAPAAEDQSTSYRRTPPAPSQYAAQGASSYHESPASSDYRPAPSAACSRSDRSRSPRTTLPTQMIVGVGECYIYPDGKYLPCKINDEPVNPEFGVTKAGKPRKRLAQACIACREKKIKCQPGEPRCAQCTKVNRECKWPTPSHPPKEPQVDVASAVAHAPLARTDYHVEPTSPLPAVMKWSSPPDVYKETYMDAAVGHQTQRALSAYDSKQVSAPKRQRAYIDETPEKPNPYASSQGAYGAHRPVPPSLPANNSFDMDHMTMDPFVKDPQMALECLELYFEHRGRGPYAVLPRRAFIQWAVTCKTKTSDDIMFLFVVMAVGSRFSTNRMKRNTGQHYAKKAAVLERERIGELTLQLAQTRLYFLLYYFAEGKNALGWEYLSSGLSACNALNFNTERGITTVLGGTTVHEYGLSTVQIIECRRRTFFAGYCMDRFIGHNSGHMGLVHDLDLFVRLPGDEASFEHGQPTVPMPYFCEGAVIEPHTGVAGEMAMLVPLVAIWGIVVAQSYRSYHRPCKSGYLEQYQRHYHSMYERLGEWEAGLPEHLRFSAANTGAAVERGCMNAYFVYHAIKFVTLMKLNRDAEVRLLPRETVRRNIARAMVDADNLLSIAGEICRAADSMKSSATADLDNALSQPFPGYAVMTACDVVTAGGAQQKVACIKARLVQAKQVLEKIGRYWFAGSRQQQRVEKRLIKLSGMDLAAMSTGVEAGLWRIAADEDAGDFLPKDHDLIHGSADADFYEAVRRVN